MIALTTLQAVNKLLAAIGDAPFAALDTGGTSVAAEAETVLDEHNRRIQARGWLCNTRTDGGQGVSLSVPVTTIGVTGGSGTFTAGETVTGGTSDATGTFHQIDGTTMYLSDASGTFQDAETLTGGTSGATKTTNTAPATVTSAEIVLAADVLSADSYGADAYRQITVRDGKLYDEDEDTADFSAAVRVVLVERLDFTALPYPLQRYIVASAAMEFSYEQTRSKERDSFLRADLRDARASAVRDEDSRDNRTLLNSRFGAGILGKAHYPIRRR